MQSYQTEQDKRGDWKPKRKRKKFNMQKYNRRSFIDFLGKGFIAVGMSPVLLESCSPAVRKKLASFKLPFSKIAPTSTDNVELAEGFNYKVLVSWDDPISDNDRFGFNNDYTAFLPFDPANPDDGILWVNHEYLDPMFVSKHKKGEPKTKEQVDMERYSVGGSLVRIKKEGDAWKVVHNDKYNRRLNGHTAIPINWKGGLKNKSEAIGTFANCSGGVTPWGNILTCEENYQGYYGETVYDEKGNPSRSPGWYEWEKVYDDCPPEHYGWVVEVNPKTGEAKKQVGLGRCCHECATVHELPDGRVVVYTGDDSNDECLYKFISTSKGSLDEGMLYVAQIETGKWLAVDFDSQPILQENFRDQTEVLIQLRKAAVLLGGTPLDRPEDIDVDPITGHVLVSLSNNKPKGNYHGSIMKVMEADDKHDSLTFVAETYLAGGEDSGFSCPDNMAFDPAGNLWITSDISGSAIGKEPYEAFKNNGLFLVPRFGEQAGQVIQVASAPFDAEFTGPYFSPDGKTLFLSVQHPGESSESIDELSSHWPNGGSSMPRSSVITIQGPSLEAVTNI